MGRCHAAGSLRGCGTGPTVGAVKRPTLSTGTPTISESGDGAVEMSLQLLPSPASMLREKGTIMQVVLEGEIQACNRAGAARNTTPHHPGENSRDKISAPPQTN
ncbi:unnamed protein product [Pleuronectes platessa]|uniref:Uncharacterized protein n=1 Tax=Pleuronectes platessa TaxID=8262 RepID=A0A9N7UBY7_PLEPL|nr:unnamed protein product [Pleuronectes platessa]